MKHLSSEQIIVKILSFLIFLIPALTFAAKPPLDDFRYTPNWQGFIDVGEGHQIYCERIGNPNGIATIFISGGPTRSFSGHHRKILNLSQFNTIFCDQRGVGLSRFQKLLNGNTTTHLVGDIERIRKFFGLQRVYLVSESWGTTLALVYAIKHPQKVLGMLLASTFLAREEDIRNFEKDESSYMKVFKNYLPHTEWGSPFRAYAERLLPSSGLRQEEKEVAASRFMYWLLGSQTSIVSENSVLEKRIEAMSSRERIQLAQVKLHYITHNFFLEDDFISKNLDKVQNIPLIFIHGKQDRVSNYLDVRKLIVGSGVGAFYQISKAGHSFESRWMFPIFRSMANGFYSNLY